MAYTEWSIEGDELVNCSCDYGCPCQFNALPTHGGCQALFFVRIAQGRYDDVPLDGLCWGSLIAWPGAIHSGNGTLQPIIETSADARQRAAIEAIMLGRDTEPGTLIWQVLSTTVTRVLPTLHKPIHLAIDVEQRTATVHVPGLLYGRVDPIQNTVNGMPEQMRLILPAGIEFTEAEFASGEATASGAIEFDFQGTHAHLAHVRWSTRGVLR